MLEIIISLAVGYLCGSFLTAEVVAHVYTGKSIGEIGTGNPGMANVMSEIGKKQGIIVLLGDIAKMLFAFVVAWLFTGRQNANLAVLWAGFGGILGHNYPFWRKFKGGKGVTVTCTWLIILMPVWGTLSCVIAGAVTLITGYLPLGGVLIPAIAIPFAFYSKGITTGILMILATIIMFTRHYSGIIRVIQGKEKKAFHR